MTEAVLPGARVIERTLSNGVVTRTTPLSPFASSQLSRIAEARFPDADKKPFLHDDPDSVLPVLDESAWNQEQASTLIARQNEWSRLALLACVQVEGDHGVYITAYADYLDGLRRLGVTLPEDDWEATFCYGILDNRMDVNALMSDVQGTTPLTAPEVADGLRIFRPQIHQSTSGNGPG